MQQLRSEIVGYFGAASAFDERVAAKFKLSRTDMRCLDLLDHQGPMTAGQLADESGPEHGSGDLPAGPAGTGRHGDAAPGHR